MSCLRAYRFRAGSGRHPRHAHRGGCSIRQASARSGWAKGVGGKLCSEHNIDDFLSLTRAREGFLERFMDAAHPSCSSLRIQGDSRLVNENPIQVASLVAVLTGIFHGSSRPKERPQKSEASDLPVPLQAETTKPSQKPATKHLSVSLMPSC